jgi:hypothetical protein
VLSGVVDSEVAANAATNRHDFLVSLEQAVKRKRAADAVVAGAPSLEQQHVLEPETVPAPSVHVPQPDEAPGLRIVPAG